MSVEPGERLPDFTTRTSDGRPWQLYERVLGDPVALWIARGGPRSGIGAAAARIAADWPELRLLAIRSGLTETNAASVADAMFPGTMLSDPGGLAEFLVDGTDDALLICDRNLRLVASWTSAPPAEWMRNCRLRLFGEMQPPAPVLEGGMAPVLMVPRVLEPGDCARLITHFEREGGVPSGMPAWQDGKQSLHVDPAAKQRRDVRIADLELSEWLALRLARCLLPEVQRAFAWQPRGYENFKLVCYGVDGPGYFRRHRDNLAPQAAHRKFALTINLNTGEYSGGGLRFPEYGDMLYSPPAGGALVFSGALAHEVTDVTKGRRYALVSFLFD